jgi:hypothetical protein
MRVAEIHFFMCYIGDDLKAVIVFRLLFCYLRVLGMLRKERAGSLAPIPQKECGDTEHPQKDLL